MRKDSINTFKNGIINDLNPINVPNTALTDCLNGTLLTYDGNEYSLQNDKGNYSLKHCKLPANYMPVGIKEYGGILYIVSYNPLENRVEIGSYPSPLQVNEIEIPPKDIDNFGSIIKENLIDKGVASMNYSELIKLEKHVVFGGDEYKLFPGDSYKLEIDENPYRYETFEYSILDEKSNIHDITKNIVKNEDFAYVGWNVPGWITAKIRLARLMSTGLNVRSFYAPETESGRTVYYEFNMRLNIEDELLKNILFDSKELYKTEVLFDIDFSGKNDEYPKHINESFTDITEWYKDNKIIWRKLNGVFSTDKDDIITITLTPKLTEFDDNGTPLYTIVYDNLKQQQQFDLSRVNDKQWSAGENSYRYYVSSDKKELMLEFDIEGPSVSSNKVNLEYRIKTLDGLNYIEGSETYWKSFKNYFGIGNNYASLTFNDLFKKEEIYILEWRFISEETDNNGDPELIKNLPSRLLITTELLDGSEDAKIYDRDITLDYLFEKHYGLINNAQKPIIDILNTNIGDTHKIISESEAIKTYCDTTIKNNTFVKEGDNIPENFNITLEKDITANAKITPMGILEGALWENVIQYEIYNVINDERILILNENTSKETDVKGHRDAVLTGESKKISSNFNYYRIKDEYNLALNIDKCRLTIVRDDINERGLFIHSWYTSSEGSFDHIISDENEFFWDFRYPIDRGISAQRLNPCYILNISMGAEFNSSPSPQTLLIFPGWEDDTSSILRTYCIESDINRDVIDVASQMYIVNDNDGELTLHTAYSSTFDLQEIRDIYQIEISAIYKDDWIYNGIHLTPDLDTGDDLLFTTCLNYNSEFKQKSKSHIYEATVTSDELIDKLVEELNFSTSLENAQQQVTNWQNHPVYLNKNNKSEIRGVYCLSDNDALNEIVKVVDKYYIDHSQPYGVVFPNKMITTVFTLSYSWYDDSIDYEVGGNIDYLKKIGNASDYFDENSDGPVLG